MAKANLAEKLKNMARGLKEEDKSGVKKIKTTETRKKENISDSKASGRKN